MIQAALKNTRASSHGSSATTDLSTLQTARTGTEQLLISSAIDRSLSSVRFDDFAGYKVFIDPQFVAGTVDQGYLVVDRIPDSFTQMSVDATQIADVPTEMLTR